MVFGLQPFFRFDGFAEPTVPFWATSFSAARAAVA